MVVNKEKNDENILFEFCNHCGRSVKFGSGWFVNRIPDLNDIVTRQDNNRKFPHGDFVCSECDEINEEKS